MATFYVLPPRECLEQAAADFLARVVPGLPAPATLWDDFLALAVTRPDVFVVHREELSADGDVHADLAACFGAEPGDVVVEVGLATVATGPRVRRSVVPPIPERVGAE
jgi:hypothetical protein